MKLKIFGLTVPVRKVRGFIEKENTVGEWVSEDKHILIDSEIVGDEFYQCIIHEIGHCMIERCGILQTKIPSEVFEIIVENFATAITENFDLHPKKKSR